MQVLIVANGHLNDVCITDYTADYLIAVDNGVQYCLRQNQRPDLAIGDFDSITPNFFEQLHLQNIPIKKYSSEKDQTDLELALLYAVNVLQADKIIVLAALGGREDMSFANVFLLMHPMLIHCDITLVADVQHMTLITAKRKFSKTLAINTTVSLLPLTSTVKGVSTHGLKYPLNDECLSMGYTRSISNISNATLVEVEIESGVLLICQDLRKTSGSS